jgi:predicted glycosyltransferase
MKFLIYSHDTFGLGNIRRILAIGSALKESYPDSSTLIISGSPMLQGFRIPAEMDYIKLPCLKRSETGGLHVRTLDMELAATVKLRSEIIRTAVENFGPDVLLVDKKPAGVAGELIAGLRHMKVYSPGARIVLILRDIMDRPEVTVDTWKRQSFYETLELYYDRALVLGDPRIFDAVDEYQVPPVLRDRVTFCGYIRKTPSGQHRERIRQELGIDSRQKLVLITTGGGEDGYRIIETYLQGLRQFGQPDTQTLVITGPELSQDNNARLQRLAQQSASVRMMEFTDDMIGCMQAADVVVSMAGYNTVSELLSLNKRAILVPRVHPVQEQQVRAERFAAKGLFRMIHPADLTPDLLMRTVNEELAQSATPLNIESAVDLNGLKGLTRLMGALIPHASQHQQTACHITT